MTHPLQDLIERTVTNGRGYDFQLGRPSFGLALVLLSRVGDHSDYVKREESSEVDHFPIQRDQGLRFSIGGETPQYEFLPDKSTYWNQ